MQGPPRNLLLQEYLRQSVDLCGRHGVRQLGKLIRSFPLWYATNRRAGSGPALSGIPWMAISAIRFLRRKDFSKSKVFEWGSGGSTIFFAMRAQQIISIEHDTEWYHEVGALLRNRSISNVNLKLIEPTSAADSSQDAADPNAFASSDERYIGKSFAAYSQHIEEYPKKEFGVVLVDGRARSSCLAKAIPHVQSGGLLVLDNSDREYYLEQTLPLLNSWKRYDFMGPVPFSLNFSKTSIWESP